MYRIKYLIGIFSGVFSLLYLLFGIVGWEDARTSMDKYTSFVLCFVHAFIAIFLFLSSLKDKRREDLRLKEIVHNLQLMHPVVTAELLSIEANLSVPDAHDFIQNAMRLSTTKTNSNL